MGNSSHWLGKVVGVVKQAQLISEKKINPKVEILKYIFDKIGVNTVADFGCGKAGWLVAAKELGIDTVHGYDIPELDISERNIKPEEFTAVDLSKIVNLNRKFDLVISTEVAEHISHQFAANFVKNLTNSGELILFSAATPYQGGLGHVNENWVEYWNALFQESGFVCFDFIRDLIWHDAAIPYYYRQNILLFSDTEMSLKLKQENFKPTLNPKTLIHPDMLIKAVHRARNINSRHTIKNDVIQYYKNTTNLGHLPDINEKYGDTSYNIVC